MRIVILMMVCAFNLNAQKFDRIFEPEYYSNKSLDELRRDSQILDIVVYDRKPVYLKINANIGEQEFYRINDSSFVFRYKINNEIIEEGNLFFDTQAELSVDSFTTFDPETYEETLNVISYHRLEKFGNWTEKNKIGERWNGIYINDKREGFWTYYDRNNDFNSCQYINGKLIGFFSPNKKEVSKYRHWIINKEFIWCKRILYTYEETVYKEEWELSLVQNEGCLNLGKFTFNDDGTFLFEEVNTKLTIGLKKVGLGKWIINDSSEIELKFANSESNIFLIEYLSKDSLKLEISID